MIPIIIILLMLFFIEQIYIHYFASIIYRNGIPIKRKPVSKVNSIFKIEKDGLKINGNELFYFKKTFFNRVQFFILYGTFHNDDLIIEIKIPPVLFILLIIVHALLIIDFVTGSKMYSSLLFIIVLNLFILKEYFVMNRKSESLLKDLS